MDCINHNTSLRTNTYRMKNASTSKSSYRLIISKAVIAKALGHSRAMIYTEIRRGTVVQINQGKPILMYLTDRGQGSYEISRKGSFNTLKSIFSSLYRMGAWH